MRFIGRKRGEQQPEKDYAPGLAGTGPVAFGYKIAWLAIRTGDTQASAAALGVTDARTVSWAEGIDAAYVARRRGQTALVFLTPAVDGWTLAVLGGVDLFDDDGTGGGALDLAALSRRFGEVQKFATNRVVEYHEWQRWADGSPVRRYCWMGESGRIRFDDGEPARVEWNLLRAADVDGDNAVAGELASEDTVMAVAAEWSIDPTTFGEGDDLPPVGLLGLIT